MLKQAALCLPIESLTTTVLTLPFSSVTMVRWLLASLHATPATAAP
jgi:hypothetical protein